jgi:molybdopterin-guanine dinucleotide biosynthesis protein
MDSVQPHTQSFTNTNISGHARVHVGNFFNFSSADSEQRAILDWLTSLDPSASHDRACSWYQEGTLGWIFDSTTFRNWCDRPINSLQVFWCRGAMGTGKTTLVARILNHLQERGSPRGSLAVVYCKYSEREALTVESVMGSILAQLYQHSEEGFSIPADVKTALQSQSRYWKRRPSLEQLKSWLHSRLEGQDTAFVLVDALDELDPRLRRKLLRSIQSMPRLKLLVTSRDAPEPDTNIFANQVTEIHAHEADLRNLMKSKFREEGTEAFRRLILKKPESDGSFSTIEEQIISKITRLAQGMCVHYHHVSSHVRP